MIGSIFKRVKQFYRAISAKLSADDNKYISTHLSPKEQKLFFAMDVVDQYHSLHVAYTIERFVIEDSRDVDREFLIRCALLHDIGRVKGDMSTFGKVFVVLVSAFFPSFADKLPAFEELDKVLEELKNRGFIIGKNGVGRNVMAFQPPLVITEENVNDILNALDLVLTENNM